MNTEAFAKRRDRVLAAMGEHAALVLPAGPEVVVGRDLELRYRPDPDLWYLTGYSEPEAVAVLRAGSDAPFTLFVRDRDPERETWTGPRGGVEAARERYGADEAHPIAELEDRLPELLKGVETVYFPLGSGRDDVERMLLDRVARGRAGRQKSGRAPSRLADPGLLLDDLRLIKDAEEIRAIREAVAVTIDGFRAGLAMAGPGIGEWQVEAAVEHAFRTGGATGPAFATIAASGANATVLHYVENSREMQPGDLLLLDAGASVGMYNGDLTRTVPVGGEFSAPQRDVYDAVLAARDAAIAAVRPGATFEDVNRAATAVLARAMVELELLQGDPAELVEDEDAIKRWFPHKTSHWLGLDVHDVGSYALDGRSRTLQPGMVLTIEPGLYIPAGSEEAPAHLRGIGVRIEDDLLVTGQGHENLSEALSHWPRQRP